MLNKLKLLGVMLITSMCIHLVYADILGNDYDFFINAAGGAAGNGTAAGPAWALNAGYNFNSIFAIEAGYTGFNSSLPSSLANQLFGIGIPNVNYNVYDVAFRATLPLPFFSLYGKAGPAINNASWSTSGNSIFGASSTGEDVNAFGGLLGAGASFNFWRMGLFLEADHFFTLSNGSVSTPTDYTAGLVGLQFNF